MSAAIQIQPMQWGDIPYMGSEELEVFTEKDAACFKDIRDVLIKHNALDRFGMCLIHKHFEMAEDEELTELTDEQGRKLTIVPRKKSEIDPASTTPTNWRFTAANEQPMVGCTCARNTGGHLGYHRGT